MQNKTFGSIIYSHWRLSCKVELQITAKKVPSTLNETLMGFFNCTLRLVFPTVFYTQVDRDEQINATMPK